MQIVKLSDYNSSSPSSKCAKVYDEIMERIGKMNSEMEQKGIKLTRKMIEDAIKDGRIPSRRITKVGSKLCNIDHNNSEMLMDVVNEEIQR